MNAHGTAHNAICSRCGASLTNVYFFNGQPVGSDCFERLTGLSFDQVRGYVREDGTIDLDARKRDMDARDAEQARTHAQYVADCTKVAESNEWLISGLAPFAEFDAQGYGMNFAGSIVRDLRNGTRANELPIKAAWIIAKMIVGRSAKKQQELVDRIYAE